MDGKESDMYRYFVNQLEKGFLALRKNVKTITLLLKIMESNTDLPCF